MKSELPDSYGFLILIILGLWLQAVSAQVQSFVGGDKHALILKEGSVFVMGKNDFGQLGIGDPNIHVEYFREIDTSFSGLVDQVAAGALHSLAVDGNGVAWAWGNNAFGQLGDSTTEDRYVPTLIEFPDSIVIKEMAAGFDHSVALDANDAIWTWGNGNPTPQRIEGLPEIKRIAAGDMHILALDVNGIVWTWGDNRAGQLGDANRPDVNEPVFVDVNGFGPIDKIAAGSYHSLALDANGGVWAWGSNSDGQLGYTDSNESVATPKLVADLNDVDCNDIAAGANHCLALDSSSRIWAWGDNSSQQLGNTSLTPQAPSVIEAMASLAVVAISAGSHTSMAISDDANAVFWGFDLIDANTSDPCDAVFAAPELPPVRSPSEISDENLVNAIKSELGLVDDPNRGVESADWPRLTRLDASGLGIVDVNMLGAAFNLEVLMLSDNAITDINPLAGLSQLRVLDLNNNLIEEVSAVADMPNLMELWLQNNRITDIRPLSGLHNLVHLNLHGNQIKEITPLSGLTELYTLWLSDNLIETVRALGTLTKLHHLLLSNNMLNPDDEDDLATLQEIVSRSNGRLWD
jgi:alpha-tubulin suppressor-like RCC1 family protein